jgi:hypothetical protein
MRWAGHVARFRDEREVFKILVGKHEGSWGDWLRGVDWILSAQDWGQWRPIMNAVMNLRVLTPRI